MGQKILIATRSFGSTSSKPWDSLREAGFESIKADMSKEMSEDRMIDLLQDVDGAIIGVVPMTKRVLESASRLKVICFHGVGVDFIDLEAAVRKGIVVANCPGANDQGVADLTIGLMIAISRTIPAADLALRNGKWGRYSGTELWRKTLGLVGFGHIGRGVARRALGFEMDILVYDPYIQSEQLDMPGVILVTLEEVIAKADFLSLHAALTDENRGMIGAEQIRQMKTTAYLINTARGGLVDEQALYQALASALIAGAALDAFVDEPPTSSPLLKLHNVVVTPHIGAHTKESIERVSMLATQNVVLTLQGGQPLHRVV
jgi:D-3-phosphoglycerate dehydrogenase